MSSIKKIYGLIGKKLGHSFSRDFFNKKFATENLSAEYVNFEIDTIEQINDIISSTPNLVGLNVTIPFKEAVIPLLSHIDPIASAIGAVNTIRIVKNQATIELQGYNTDIIGFTESLRPLLNHTHKNALLLGTGGAAKAMLAGMQSMGLTVKCVSRNEGVADYTYADLTKDVINQHSVIVNSTPLGMWPDIDSAPNIPYEFITENHIAFDAVYNPNPTKFLTLCQQNGAIIKSGLEMLHGQAIAAWNIWNSTTKSEV